MANLNLPQKYNSSVVTQSLNRELKRITDDFERKLRLEKLGIISNLTPSQFKERELKYLFDGVDRYLAIRAEGEIHIVALGTPGNTPPSGGGGGTTDHGALTGLTDQVDHLYAVTIDGTRVLTADWEVGSKRLRNFGASEVATSEPASPVTGMFWYDTDATAATTTFSIVTKTANYTLTASDVVVKANGTLTLTLPTAVGIGGKVYYTKNIGTGTVTIDADGTETIDGDLSFVSTTQYESITVVSDSANWCIL